MNQPSLWPLVIYAIVILITAPFIEIACDIFLPRVSRRILAACLMGSMVVFTLFWYR